MFAGPTTGCECAGWKFYRHARERRAFVPLWTTVTHRCGRHAQELTLVYLSVSVLKIMCTVANAGIGVRRSCALWQPQIDRWPRSEGVAAHAQGSVLCTYGKFHGAQDSCACAEAVTRSHMRRETAGHLTLILN